MSIKECPVDTSGESAGVPLFEIHKMRKHPTALSENLTDDTILLKCRSRFCTSGWQAQLMRITQTSARANGAVEGLSPGHGRFKACRLISLCW